MLQQSDAHYQKLAANSLDTDKDSYYTIPHAEQLVSLDSPRHASQLPSDFHGQPKSDRGAKVAPCNNPQSDAAMAIDAVTLHVLWRETNQRLDVLAQAVGECKRVDEASNFGRWLQFSGVLKILEANPAGLPLPVDGKALRKKTEDLVYECGELYKGGKHDPKYAASDIAEINRKLDVLAFHIGRAIPSSSPLTATTANTGDAAEPMLQVLQGGAS